MKMIRFGPERSRQVDLYGSRFEMTPVHAVPGAFFVGAMYIPAGGLVGYHPATSPQLFMVVQGSGWVRAGDDGERQPVTAGDAAFWEEGEMHEAGSDEGMQVIVLEYGLPAEQHRFPVAGECWTVSLARGDEAEREALDQVERLLQTYDLAKWSFTRRIHIERGARPQSHPLLTLNTAYLERPDLALATLLHQQIRWFEQPHRQGASAAAQAELKEHFPGAPAEGAYLDLIIATLEARALQEVLGRERSRAVLSAREGWAYRQAEEQRPAIELILERHGLLL